MLVKRLIDEPYIRILGRNVSRMGERVTLFHSASGIELDIAASELWIEFISDYSFMEPWISIEINGCRVSRFMFDKGIQRRCIFRGMNAGVKKHVRILREIQAMSDDEDCLLQIGCILHDGEIYPMQKKEKRIEFVGNSITSGEGAIGAQCEEDWISMFCSASDCFTVKTADILNADFRVVSQSGWGVLSSWDNNLNKVLPRYYEQVCGMTGGERNRLLGAPEPYDFDSWRADAVVINLGTNDESAFHQPEWSDEATGRRFKQRLNDDGSYNSEDIERFVKAAEDFLWIVRKNNPNADIIWAYGMLGTAFLPYIKEAVNRYTAGSTDKRVSVLELPEAVGETMGARQHPGALCHKAAAKVLAAYIDGLWKEDKHGL